MPVLVYPAGMRKHSCTIYLDEGAWQAFRMQCLARKVSASGELAEMVTARLKEWGPLQVPPAAATPAAKKGGKKT